MKKLVFAVGAVLMAAMILFMACQDCSAQQARPRRGPRGGRGPGPEEGPPTAKTEAEKSILGVLDDIYKNQRRGMMNVPPEDGRLLRLLTEAVGVHFHLRFGGEGHAVFDWSELFHHGIGDGLDGVAQGQADGFLLGGAEGKAEGPGVFAFGE